MEPEPSEISAALVQMLPQDKGVLPADTARTEPRALGEGNGCNSRAKKSRDLIAVGILQRKWLCGGVYESVGFWGVPWLAFPTPG